MLKKIVFCAFDKTRRFPQKCDQIWRFENNFRTWERKTGNCLSESKTALNICLVLNIKKKREFQLKNHFSNFDCKYDDFMFMNESKNVPERSVSLIKEKYCLENCDSQIIFSTNAKIPDTFIYSFLKVKA